MRVLKIVLTIFSSVILLGVLYGLWEEFSKEGITRVPLLGIIYIGLAIPFSLVNIIYHLKSFRFYRRKEKRNLAKKFSKTLWIGTICFSAFLFLLIGTTLYNKAGQFLNSNYKTEDTLFLFVLVILSLLGFLEVSLLKKRIKRLKVECETKDEISSIGNSTI